MTGDAEVERDDLDTLDRSLHCCAPAIAVPIVGELHTNKQFGCSDRADRDIGVIGQHLGPVRVIARERNHGAGVED